MNVVHELARPFPANYIHDDGKGNAYVPHHVVVQRLIHIFGCAPKTSIVREIYDDKVLTGVVMRMEIQGFCVEEIGEADNPQAKTNGAKAKSAASDAYKRCAMRLGLGLHLWAQKDYFLFDKLTADLGSRPAPHREEGGSLGEGSPPPPAPSRPDRVDEFVAKHGAKK